MKEGKKGWREQASAHFLGKGGAMAPLCQIKVGPQFFCTFLYLIFWAAAGENFAKTALLVLKPSFQLSLEVIKARRRRKIFENSILNVIEKTFPWSNN